MKELYNAPKADVVSFVSAENLAATVVSLNLNFLNLEDVEE